MPPASRRLRNRPNKGPDENNCTTKVKGKDLTCKPDPAERNYCLICGKQSIPLEQHVPLKQLLKAVRTIFSYLHVSESNLNKIQEEHSVQFCNECMDILHSICLFQKNIQILEMKIEHQVETLGNKIFQDTGRDQSVMKTAIGVFFLEPVFSNFRIGNLPSPKVKISFDLVAACDNHIHKQKAKEKTSIEDELAIELPNTPVEKENTVENSHISELSRTQESKTSEHEGGRRTRSNRKHETLKELQNHKLKKSSESLIEQKQNAKRKHSPADSDDDLEDLFTPIPSKRRMSTSSGEKCSDSNEIDDITASPIPETPVKLTNSASKNKLTSNSAVTTLVEATPKKTTAKRTFASESKGTRKSSRISKAASLPVTPKTPASTTIQSSKTIKESESGQSTPRSTNKPAGERVTWKIKGMKCLSDYVASSKPDTVIDDDSDADDKNKNTSDSEDKSACTDTNDKDLNKDEEFLVCPFLTCKFVAQGAGAFDNLSRHYSNSHLRQLQNVPLDSLWLHCPIKNCNYAGLEPSTSENNRPNIATPEDERAYLKCQRNAAKLKISRHILRVHENVSNFDGKDKSARDNCPSPSKSVFLKTNILKCPFPDSCDFEVSYTSGPSKPTAHRKIIAHYNVKHNIPDLLENGVHTYVVVKDNVNHVQCPECDIDLIIPAQGSDKCNIYSIEEEGKKTLYEHFNRRHNPSVLTNLEKLIDFSEGRLSYEQAYEEDEDSQRKNDNDTDNNEPQSDENETQSTGTTVSGTSNKSGSGPNSVLSVRRSTKSALAEVPDNKIPLPIPLIKVEQSNIFLDERTLDQCDVPSNEPTIFVHSELEDSVSGDTSSPDQAGLICLELVTNDDENDEEDTVQDNEPSSVPSSDNQSEDVIVGTRMPSVSELNNKFYCKSCGMPWSGEYEELLKHNWSHKSESEQDEAIGAGLDIPQNVREELIRNGRSCETFKYSAELIAAVINLEMVSNLSHYCPEEKKLSCQYCEYSEQISCVDDVKEDLQGCQRLIIHFLDKHFTRMHSCEICGQGFSASTYLEAHRRKAHS